MPEDPATDGPVHRADHPTAENRARPGTPRRITQEGQGMPLTTDEQVRDRDEPSTSRYPSAWFVAPTAAVPAVTAVAVTGSAVIGALSALLVTACVGLAALMI